MANVLDMADQATITALWRRGWSQRRIARETGIHRETVGRYIRLALAAERAADGSKPAISTPGSDGENRPAASSGEPPKPAIPTAGSDPPKPAISTLGSATLASAGSGGRRSLCERLREVIQAKLETGLSAVRTWQDLVGEQQFEGSYQSVKRFVRQLEAAAPLAGPALLPARRVLFCRGQVV
jgi:transposase